MQHTILKKRLTASRASSQTSFHLKNIMNISRQWSQLTRLRAKNVRRSGAPSAGGPMTWHN